MRKLRLRLDELAVDTFPTVGGEVPGRGTVDAHAVTPRLTCTLPSLKTDLTCCPCTPRF